MTLVSTLLTILVLATFARNRQIQAENAKLRASQAVAKIAGRTEDEEVAAYLEVSAATSPLAKRLLGAVAEVPKLEDGKQAAPDWMHDPDVAVPAEESWKLFYEEVSAEPSDDAKVQAVKAFLRGYEEFSVYEKTRLVALCTSEEGRCAMREVLYPLEETKAEPQVQPPLPPPSSPAFRWSKQSHKAIVTPTCKCRNPAEGFDCRGGKLFVRCNSCSIDEKGMYYLPDNHSIYVLSNGDAWRIIDGRWIKASID